MSLQKQRGLGRQDQRRQIPLYPGSAGSLWEQGRSSQESSSCTASGTPTHPGAPGLLPNSPVLLLEGELAGRNPEDPEKSRVALLVQEPSWRALGRKGTTKGGGLEEGQGAAAANAARSLDETRLS